MTTKTQARAPARALVGAAAFGSLAGLAIGCAYLGGVTARENVLQARAGHYTGQLALAASAPDHNAQAGDRDPQGLFSAQTAANPDAAAAGLRRVTFRPPTPAAPFRMEGAVGPSQDLQCLTEAVYWEARGEGSTGMAAVAQVILNRVRHPEFPKTVCGVVFQGVSEGDCQFSFACQPHSEAIDDEAWRRAREVATRALSGHVMAAVGQATNFHAVSVAPAWMTSLQRVAQIGSHIFYRIGHPGRLHNFEYTAQPAGQANQEPAMASFAPSFGPPPQQSAPVEAAMGAQPQPQVAAQLPPKPTQAPAGGVTQPPPPAARPAPSPAAAGAQVVDAQGISGG